MATYDEAIDASKDGRAARRHGEPQSANPHPWGTPERRHWNLAWLGARVEEEPRCADCGGAADVFDFELAEWGQRVYRCETCRGGEHATPKPLIE